MGKHKAGIYTLLELYTCTRIGSCHVNIKAIIIVLFNVTNTEVRANVNDLELR